MDMKKKGEKLKHKIDHLDLESIINSARTGEER